MDWEGTLALIFCGVIPLGLLGGIIVSRGIEREQGEEAAKKYHTPILLVIVGLIILTFAVSAVSSLFSIGESLIDMLMLLLSVLMAAVLVYLVYKRSRLKSEAVIFDLGRAERKYALLAGIFFLIMTLLNASQLIFLEYRDPNIIIQVIMWGVFSLYWLASSLGSVLITEEGFSRFTFGMVPWEKITGYDWQGGLNRRLRLLHEGRPIVSFVVRKEDWERVEEILETHIRNFE